MINSSTKETKEKNTDKVNPSVAQSCFGSFGSYVRGQDKYG